MQAVRPWTIQLFYLRLEKSKKDSKRLTGVNKDR